MDSIERILETAFAGDQPDPGQSHAHLLLQKLVAPAAVAAYAFYNEAGRILLKVGDLASISRAPTGGEPLDENGPQPAIISIDLHPTPSVTGSFACVLRFPPGSDSASLVDKDSEIKSLVHFWYWSLLEKERAAELESRLKLVLSENEILEKEHRRVVAMNLEEREGRLNEHRASAARLEEEVAMRTAELRQRNEELERARRDIEKHLATLRLQRHECEQAMHKAEEANVSKTRFLANMSHEVRTPLTAILGYSDVILDQYVDDMGLADLREKVEVIRRNGEHLLDVINDILDIAKIESGKLEFELTKCDPTVVVQEVASSFKEIAAKKGLQLRAVPVGSLPQQITSDPVRLKQILMNLIGNALKFTAQGQVELRYGLSDPNLGPPMLQFVVRDSGIGIPASVQDEIFEPFAQADSSTRRNYGGTGLGLTISRRLARTLGGDVVFSSNPDGGSTFTATIAMHASAKAPTPVAQNAADPPQSLADLEERLQTRKWSVLLVEDSIDNQRVISFHLTRCGAAVQLAHNGAEGVDAATDALSNGSPFDVVLMDMQMPVMDGYDATQELRRRGYSGWIIALTAHAMKEDRLRCLEAGCDDYATKPINRETLLRQIARCIL